MKATNEALDAGIEVTKPGNTANDVAKKFWGVLDKYGIKKESRTGYSIGIGYPPDGLVAELSARYILLYELITGERFVFPDLKNINQRIIKNIKELL